MGSSNRHWPSMFKSKPCNTTTHHQWQNDLINSSIISSANCHRTTPYTPGSAGCDQERTPAAEPKPRWNPRPEQIRILEAIFNSGMVNPPRDEIRKISVQLQEYGQVGDANVFYWFQNRKSRSKHKHLRQLQNSTYNKPAATNKQQAKSSSSSSSSSSDKSSPNSSNEKVIFSVGSNSINGIHHDQYLLNSPTNYVNQHPFLQASTDFLTPFVFPEQQNGTHVGLNSGNLTQAGFCFADVTDDQSSHVGNYCPSFLLSELMLINSTNCNTKKDHEDHEKMQENLSYSSLITAPITADQSLVPPSVSVQSPTNYIIQGEQVGPTKSTVFINDVCFEVGVGPFNIREAFGDDAMLIQSTGHPVLTNYWGVTLEPLRHGAFYYLI